MDGSSLERVKIAMPNVATFTKDGSLPNPFKIRIKAMDAAANWSPFSDAMTISIPDATDVDPAKSWLGMQSNGAVADGAATNIVRVRVRDMQDNPKGGVVVTLDPVAGVTFIPANRQCTTNVPGPTMAGGWCEIQLKSSRAGQYPLRAKLNGVALGREITATFMVETTPPTRPPNLRAEDIAQTRITLRWGRSSDNVGVTGYEVARDGNPIDTTNYSTTHKVVTDLAPDTTYHFRVRAKDTAGNWSAPAEIPVRTSPGPDTTPPTAPIGLRVVSQSGRTLAIAWEAASDNVGVAGYKGEFYCGEGVQLWPAFDKVATTATTVTAPKVMDNYCAFREKYLRVRAFDAAGNVSPWERLTLPDLYTPDLSAPTNFVVVPQGNRSVRLNWAASQGATNYRLAVSPGGTYFPTGTQYTLNNLAPGTTYYFQLSARNATGESQPVHQRYTTPRSMAEAQPRLVGHLTAWGDVGRDYRAVDLARSGAAARLTHLQYAYGRVKEGKCILGDAQADYRQHVNAENSVDGLADSHGYQPLAGHWHQLQKIKAQYPQLKALLSLGGPDSAAAFAEAAQPERRAAFVASCIDLFVRGNLPEQDGVGGIGSAAALFDGLDVAWEQPSAHDQANYAELLAEFRRQLDAERPGLLLTATVGAHASAVTAVATVLSATDVDFVSLIGYDPHGLRTQEVEGAFQWTARHQAPLFNGTGESEAGLQDNLNDAVLALLEGGVPAEKLNLGMAFFGRGWRGVANVNNGLYQIASGPAEGGTEEGIQSYRALKSLGWSSHYDADAQAHWIFDRNVFWSYDDPTVVRTKMQYLKLQGLGGVTIWNLGGDDDGELLDIVSEELLPE
jgi:chitinase